MRKARTLLPGAELGDYDLVAEMSSDELLSIWAARLRIGNEREHVMLLRLRSAANALPGLRHAFVREARAMSHAPTRRVPRVLDAAVINGEAFAALEPIDGLPLSDLLAAASERGETLTLPALIQLSVQVAETLELLHRVANPAAPKGIVHGDLGPHSIWVTPEGRVRLLPTGLGQVACHPDAPRSSDHLRYKAPEQVDRPLSADARDPRVDVFAFGAVLWEAFVGHRLGRGTEELPLPQSDAGDASQGLSYVLERTLSREREARFSGGAELHGAFSVLERRLQRELTARRRFSAIAASGSQPDANAALTEAFRRLVGERYRQRRDDLRLLLGS